MYVMYVLIHNRYVITKCDATITLRVRLLHNDFDYHKDRFGYQDIHKDIQISQFTSETSQFAGYTHV